MKETGVSPNGASPTLQFFGGAGTVTGSKYLIQDGQHQLLLDAGLFQGPKELRLRNWSTPPFRPAEIEAVVLSHAHIDHSGYLPLLVRQGFRGEIFCTSGTADLLAVMLLDAAHLQEEDADHANRQGYSEHKPALPLYTIRDAEATLKQIKPIRYDEPVVVADWVTAIFRRAGHILGSATVELQIGGANRFRLVFSGDLGRWDQPILRDPELVPQADTLLLESTYGGRRHTADSEGELARVVNDAVKRGGALVIPAFAVGRTQQLVWMLRQLEEQNKIPSVPVYVDSPMAINVSAIYCRHPEEHDLDMAALMDEKRCPLCCRQHHLVKTVEESKALGRLTGPCIIISASGMATGGRVLHHLEQRLPDPRTTVLLVGYQGAGTRGRSLQDGAATVQIHGQEIPVRATIETLDGLSAHADQEEIFRWLAGFKQPPQQTYLVHGEPEQAQALAQAIRTRLGWNVHVAQDGQTVDLAP